MNTVLTPERSRHLHGLIIDLRINGGGSDALGIHIAERYTGPVAVLTGGSTVSAGETFTQALIDRPGRSS